MKKLIGKIGIIAILLALILTASAVLVNAQSPSPSPSASPAASPLATLPAGSSVEVLAVWGGSELESFQAMVAPWQQQTGGTMNFTGTRDLTAVLTTRIQAGNPPDIAILPNPGLVTQFANANNLRPLNAMLNMNTINQQYSQTWLSTGTVRGSLYSIPIKATNKGMIWYNPKTFSANSWQIPANWESLISLSNTIVSAQKAPANPWAMGMEAAQASGFPGTDWIAQIFLSKYGGAAYDQWVSHQIPWTDPRIKDAWQMWGTIVNTPNYVPGGAQAALATNFQSASYWPYQSPPQAAMYYEGDFVQGFITSQFPNLVAVQDFDFFPFPAISAAASPAASPTTGASPTGAASPTTGASPTGAASPTTGASPTGATSPTTGASPAATASPTTGISPTSTASPGASSGASPAASPAAGQAITGGADLIVAFKDTPAVRSFVSYLATPQAQSIWVKRGGFTSLNNAVSLNDYPDPIARKSAQQLLSATTFRFGAGDLMPGAMQTSWWAGVLQYLQNPNQLDSILSSLENTARTAYPSASPSPSPTPSPTGGASPASFSR